MHPALPEKLANWIEKKGQISVNFLSEFFLYFDVAGLLQTFAMPYEGGGGAVEINEVHVSFEPDTTFIYLIFV